MSNFSKPSHLCVRLSLLLFLFPIFTARADIKVLVGTSTSGKSSIAKAFLELEPNRQEFDLDLVHDPLEAPESGALERLIDEAIDLAKVGQLILIHADLPKRFLDPYRAHSCETPYQIILIYCPFQELISRIDTRNSEAHETGNESNLRDPLMPLDQFSRLYRFAAEETGGGLEIVEAATVIQAYEDQWDKMIEYARTLNRELPEEEQILVDRSKSVEEFKASLGFEVGMGTVAIVPKTPDEYAEIYHNDSDTSVAEIARKIHG